MNNKYLLAVIVSIIFLSIPKAAVAASETEIVPKGPSNYVAAASYNEKRPALTSADSSSQSQQVVEKHGPVHWKKLMFCLILGISFCMTGVFIMARISRWNKPADGSLTLLTDKAAITGKPDIEQIHWFDL